MAEERVQRRLAAILATDIAGYSRLMGADEEGTLAQLKALRKSLIDPTIEQHRGRIVKTIGDGALVEFASAVDAVRCAVDIQRAMAERNSDIPDDRRIEFRIGINVGDIILDEGDIYGDGVNFADGIVEDIITGLSHMRWLFVIARNSSFTYKGRAVDVKQVGRELGVRYVLEGSVRKAGHRVRITGQLIDAANGAHLWADRFDGALEDIFDLQDQVTTSVIGAIAPKLEQAEIERAKRKPTENLDAYDYYLRGIASIHAVFGGTEEAVGEALRLFYRAIELDPNFASAYGMAAWCYVLRKNYGWSTDDAQEIQEVERLARQAGRFAKEDAVALYTGG